MFNMRGTCRYYLPYKFLVETVNNTNMGQKKIQVKKYMIHEDALVWKNKNILWGINYKLSYLHLLNLIKTLTDTMSPIVA